MTVTHFSHTAIESLEYTLGDERIESAALEVLMAPAYARLSIPARCLESLTGIVARRFWNQENDIPTTGAAVCEKALAKSARQKSDIDLLVSTSVSKEYLEPSVAALIHGELGLPDTCESFDVSNACLGFLSGMKLAAGKIEAGEIDTALVVAAESSRPVVESTVAKLNDAQATMNTYKEYLATLTLGSGAVAAVLTRDDLSTTSHRFKGIVQLNDSKSSRICIGTYQWMKTDAPALLVAGVALAKKTYALACSELDFSDDNIKQYICHQVGSTHLQTVMKTLGLAKEKAFKTFPECGNMGSAAVPLTLKMAVDEGVITQGDHAALMGIGSGLNCAMAHVVW